jgi:DNA-directed RNA polymerase
MRACKNKVLGCIGDLFRGAKDIQNWLNMVARMVSRAIPPERLEHALRTESPKRKRTPAGAAAPRIGKEQMTSMIWTTPLGLPIVQPYRKTKRRQVYTSIQSVYISDPNVPSSGELSPPLYKYH